jgi:hypothetical protein
MSLLLERYCALEAEVEGSSEARKIWLPEAYTPELRCPKIFWYAHFAWIGLWCATNLIVPIGKQPTSSSSHACDVSAQAIILNCRAVKPPL